VWLQRLDTLDVDFPFWAWISLDVYHYSASRWRGWIDKQRHRKQRASCRDRRLLYVVRLSW